MATTRSSTLLMVCLVCTLTFILLRYYLKPASNTTIVQPKLSEFEIKLLFEKNPIIIEERIVQPKEILDAFFKYLYTYKTQLPSSSKWRQNKARYLVIHNAEYLQIAHPSNKGNPTPNYIDIRIQPNQLIILPALWLYKVKGGSLTALYDIPSMLLWLFV
jgi:hypothetical protein